MALKKHDIVGHLTAAIKDGDANAFPQALGEAVQAFGMERLIDATGYTQRHIRRAMRPETKPRFKTVQDMARGMNRVIRLVPAENC